MRVLAAGLVVIALGWGATAEAETVQCDMGEELRKAGDTEAAKARFNKALDEGAAGKDCGVKGLAAVAGDEKAAADENEKNDNEQTLTEAKDDVKNFFTANWIWLGLVLLFWLLWTVAYVIRILKGDDERVRVKAPASSADLAQGIVAAANTAGGKHAPSSKIYVASDDTESTVAADLGKVFRLPGTVPIADLLKRPPFSGLLTQRLTVSGASAGGWGVLDLTYRQRLRAKRHVRIPLDLGDIDDDKKTEVMALIGGFWLHTVLQAKPAPVADRNAVGLRAHALFRAGATRHASGETAVARACYSAMPSVGQATAPFAWAGRRLNEMMAYKIERRWLEARSIAAEIKDFPSDEFISEHSEGFGEEQLDELRLRQRYMMANVRVDHWYAVKDEPNTFGPSADALKQDAHVAVERLAAVVGDEPGRGDLEPLHAAGRMIVLAYRIAAGENVGIEQVRRQLGVDEPDADRVPVSASGYYDAACAVSLLLGRPAAVDGSRETLTREGLWLLKTAVAATREDRRARAREMAKSDPMLVHLKEADGFAEAIGEGGSPEAEHAPTLAESLASAIAAMAAG